MCEVVSVKGMHLFSMPQGDRDMGPVSAFALDLEINCEHMRYCL